ncbi:MAG TPA: holo-ACP synthase [Oscillospiraceae bacterium]|nr:holo-ACP synthase [Oscillospiraceae bacterium]
MFILYSAFNIHKEGWIVIIGVGTDLLRIGRIRDMGNGEKQLPDAFLRKCYTKRERDEAKRHSDPILYFAVRFAGKEAVFKCLGMNGDDVRLSEIEILERDNGKPYVVLSDELEESARKSGITGIQLSLSYETDYALAFAVADG